MFHTVWGILCPQSQSNGDPPRFHFVLDFIGVFALAVTSPASGKVQYAVVCMYMFILYMYTSRRRDRFLLGLFAERFRCYAKTKWDQRTFRQIPSRSILTETATNE